LEFFTTLYKYREYLKQSVARDLRKKYKRSVLGYLWSMLEPLFMITILTVVFANIMSRVDAYSVFLFTALLPWRYFSSTALGSLDIIRGNMNIIQQVPIPKFIFSLSLSASNLVNLALSILPLFLVMFVVGRPIPWTAVAFPLIVIPLFFTSMGFALVFSVANVFFDDTKHLTGLALQALYYLTPILYGRDHLPQHLLGYLIYNPMFYICEFSRNVFYDGILPDPKLYLFCVAQSLVFLAFGLWIFKKTEQKFIYFL
jgi:ABC-2 type transport system permease protein